MRRSQRRRRLGGSPGRPGPAGRTAATIRGRGLAARVTARKAPAAQTDRLGTAAEAGTGCGAPPAGEALGRAQAGEKGAPKEGKAQVGHRLDMEYEIVLANGRIVDGCGNPWFWGDLAIDRGRVIAAGAPGTLKGQRTIDAAGRFVVPGFVDVHTHSDLSILVNRRAESVVRQ